MSNKTKKSFYIKTAVRYNRNKEKKGKGNIMSMYTLVTSNENKLKEFKRYGLTKLQIEKGKDLPEVDADPVTVILHKAKAAGPGRVVEDTSLFVEGKDIGTNIRWLVDSLQTCKGLQAVWDVYLGVNDGESITVYKGTVEGVIVDTYTHQVGFGFDCYFQPIGQEDTLYDLENKGQKEDYSARKRAVELLLKKESVLTIAIENIPEWDGPYQK